MSRAPELGDQCRPGGSCPECNAEPNRCIACGDEVEDDGTVRICLACAAADEAARIEDEEADRRLNEEREREV